MHWLIEELEIIDSTHTYALKKLSENCAEGTVIWAHQQTAGRGQRPDKVWTSPAGNLYASLILKPACKAVDISQLGFVVSLALYYALCEIGIDLNLVALKWPNDVLIESKKVGGILLETMLTSTQALEGVVVGIGLNVGHHPELTRFPATHLQAHVSELQSVRCVLDSVLRHIEQQYAIWRHQGFENIRTEWIQHAAFLNQEVMTVQSVKGIMKGIDEQGYLLLENSSGIVRLASGSVELCQVLK